MFPVDIVNYSITTFSNKPFSLEIKLLLIILIKVPYWNIILVVLVKKVINNSHHICYWWIKHIDVIIYE